VTLTLLRHEKKHQTNGNKFFHFESPLIKISAYANECKQCLIATSQAHMCFLNNKYSLLRF